MLRRVRRVRKTILFPVVGIATAAAILVPVIYHLVVSQAPVVFPVDTSTTAIVNAGVPPDDPLLRQVRERAAAPVVSDLYANDYVPAVSALADAVAAYREQMTTPAAWEAAEARLAPILAPKLRAALKPLSLSEAQECHADLIACLARKAIVSMPEGGSACRMAGYIAGLAASSADLAHYVANMPQRDTHDCMAPALAGAADRRKVEEVQALLSSIAAAELRLRMAGLVARRYQGAGRAPDAAAIMTLVRTNLSMISGLRSEVLNLLARHGAVDDGLQIIGTGGEGWESEMERFRRDLRHWGHDDEAERVRNLIEQASDKGMFGKSVGALGKMGGWTARNVADVGRGIGSVRGEDYDYPPTEWRLEGEPPDFDLIERLEPNEKMSALRAVLSDMRTVETRARWDEAGARAIAEAMRNPEEVTDMGWADLALSQVRAGRLWAAGKVIDRIVDPDTRAKAASQAVVDALFGEAASL